MSERSLFITTVVCSLIAVLSMATLAYCEFVIEPSLERPVLHPEVAPTQSFDGLNTIIEEAYFNTASSIPDTGTPMDEGGTDSADNSLNIIAAIQALREEEFNRLRIADSNFLFRRGWIRACMKQRFIQSLKTYETVRTECEEGIE